jgi:hypothetical protein
METPATVDHRSSTRRAVAQPVPDAFAVRVLDEDGGTVEQDVGERDPDRRRTGRTDESVAHGEGGIVADPDPPAGDSDAIEHHGSRGVRQDGVDPDRTLDRRVLDSDVPRGTDAVAPVRRRESTVAD